MISKSTVDAQCSQRQVDSFRADEIKQLQWDIQGALEQTKMEMDASRHQTERNQHDVELWARQQKEAADALQRAQDERENTGNQLPEGFSVRVMNPAK